MKTANTRDEESMSQRPSPGRAQTITNWIAKSEGHTLVMAPRKAFGRTGQSGGLKPHARTVNPHCSTISRAVCRV